MKRVASILFTTLIVCAWDVRPQAASTTTPTIDQWLSLKTILKKEASPRISPDGRSVAYSIRTPVWETNSFDDQIWIADVSSGESYQLTEAKGSSSNQVVAGRQADRIHFLHSRRRVTDLSRLAAEQRGCPAHSSE